MTLVVVARPGHAALNECLLEYDGVPSAAEEGGTFDCTDCDPSCDSDQVATPDKACTFNIRVCANQPGSGCTAADIKKVKIKKRGRCKVKGLKFTPNGSSSVCGAFTGVVVKTKKKGRKPGKCKVIVSTKSTTKPRQKDKDVLTLTCNPQTAATCPATTTTTVGTTTTTTAPAVCGDGVKQGIEQCDDGNLTDNDGCDSNCTLPNCGNGIVNGGETCDPPCSDSCGAGMFCDSTCNCVAQSACSCGTPDPARLSFTTTTPLMGDCGSVLDGTGAELIPLACGGLYFGGGGDSVPLPAAVPDTGNSLTKVCCSGTDLTLAATSEAETTNLRTCTSAGCLFGPPLPIPNTGANAVSLSTCVVNIVAQNAVGTAACTDGSSSLSLPLTSEVFLYGDLLNGSTEDRPDVPGIQPCPVCRDSVCQGGPNHGLACTPGSTQLKACESGAKIDKGCNVDADCDGSPCTIARSPYPTSHDCPPTRVPNSNPIGTLPIGFALTTSTTSDTVQASGSQTNVFCGYCRDLNDTFCFQGDPGSGCPASTGIKACNANSDCAEPFEACEQKTEGAFMQGAATTLTETGSPAGALATGNAPQASTLVSVFCIPPTFNAAIDAAADLPGPGAVALPGEVQLLP